MNLESSEETFLIGGYGPGIYASQLDTEGKMKEPVLVAQLEKPNFFVQHPRLNVLYAVGVANPPRSDSPGQLVSFTWDSGELSQLKAGALKEQSSQPIPLDVACHVSVDPQGEFVLVANYGKGSAVLYPIRETGELEPNSHRVEHQGKGANPSRQSRPHAHCSVWDQSGKHLLVADLGVDKVVAYEIDRQKRLLVSAPSKDLNLIPGAGPRHFVFSNDHKFIYVINELDMTISLFAWNGGNSPERIQTVSTLPDGASDPSYSTAEILLHPSGKFLYGSNRGHDTIASFAVDRETGKLQPLGHTGTKGKTPRNFRISPDGRYLLAENQQSNSIVSFAIDSETGELKDANSVITAPSPACIKFLRK